MTTGSIIVPAHNEAEVIVRTVGPLAPLVERGVEIIVSANGCTDDTAARVRSIAGVVVLESSRPSKAQALNVADSMAASFPRLYLDADVTITAEAVVAVFDRLRVGGVLAARPPFRYDMTGADRLVAAYYRARNRIPVMHQHLWGAGAYAVSQVGHRRLGSFPELTADDLYVDELFERNEIDIVETDPVLIRCPPTWTALLSTLRRVQGGREQLSERQEISRIGGMRPLLAGVHGLHSFGDATLYGLLSLFARIMSRSRPNYWYRDDASRLAAGADGPLTKTVGSDGAAARHSDMFSDHLNRQTA